MTGNNPWRM